MAKGDPRSATRQLLLAIDDHSLPLKKSLCLYLSKPEVRAAPVLTPSRDDRDAPDFISTSFYGTVLFDDGLYRMWYYATGARASAHEGKDGHAEPFVQGPMCYAESEDGLNWTKPNLGQVLYKGSRENNVIDLPETWLPNPRTEGITLIKDEEEPDPARRYKLMYNYHPDDRDFYTVRTATSHDGLNWTAGSELPIDEFVEQASFYKHDGLYIINAQTCSPYQAGEGGAAIGRQGFAWVSPDFDNWLQESAASFLLPEPADPADRGPRMPYDQVHLGVGAAGLGNVVVGLYCIWHNPDYTMENLDFSGDLGLVVSNDGLYFREPVKGHVFLSAEESPATPIEGRPYPTILYQGNGIVNAGDETRIYHGRGRWGDIYYGRPFGEGKYTEDMYSEVALATLPRDRWGAVGLFPDRAEGSVWSAPVRLPEGQPEIVLNADDADTMRVEISDARFGLIPGYSGADSGVVTVEGGLDCPVEWSGEKLAALAGKQVRLRVHLKRREREEPRLYAVYISP